MIGLACGRWAHLGLGLHEVFFGKGNFVRLVIVSVIFLLQLPAVAGSEFGQIFASISYNDWRSPLLATGIYGVVNLITISLFFDLGVEWFGRKTSLFISALGMVTLFFIVGAILKTHPPPETSSDSIVKIVARVAGHAGMLYIHVCFYSIGGDALSHLYYSCLLALTGLSSIFALEKHQFGVNWDYHFDLGMLNRTSFLLIYLSDVLDGASSYSNWINTYLYERTNEKFGIFPVPEVLRTRLNMASYSDEAASKFELNSSKDWLRRRQGVALPILPPTTLDA
ncbi:hypothetical protein C8J57DRAFT_1605631 [Mycena rebaudengoi]|nr:hypothetical protein C8J57DRAFT_1605631 [Mycena rebaudengoi]